MTLLTIGLFARAYRVLFTVEHGCCGVVRVVIGPYWGFNECCLRLSCVMHGLPLIAASYIRLM